MTTSIMVVMNGELMKTRLMIIGLSWCLVVYYHEWMMRGDLMQMRMVSVPQFSVYSYKISGQPSTNHPYVDSTFGSFLQVIWKIYPQRFLGLHGLFHNPPHLHSPSDQKTMVRRVLSSDLLMPLSDDDDHI